jgi:OmpA-OmpF porin, OOP family
VPKMKYFVVLYFIFFCLQNKSQNLVPNPSFEEFISFDTSHNKGWHKVQESDTPDYFNLSNDHPYNNIFKDFLGGTKPKSGNGYVGIFCLRVNPKRSIKNIREFIESPLLTTLEKDSLYKVEISLCLDAESNIAIKSFGIYFSRTPTHFIQDSKMFVFKPQIEFNSSFLDSTNNWITLESLYKALGNEKYVVLGNFKPDNIIITKPVFTYQEKGKKKKWELVPREKASYYYLDDVKIEKVTLSDNVPIVTMKIDETIKDTFNLNEIQLDTAILLKNIIFEFNKSDLLPQSYEEINKLYHLMITHNNIRIKLEGYTDNIGSYEFNLQLSIKRVESVVNYLVKNNIDPTRIEFSGYSFTHPVASNETEEGRKLNRRVTFKVIEK